ncbi:MAG: response regulator transcription factor [Gammaproteobacteria bacterium]|nr:response regulator transcription factor [Gammaproteobacteria bacterium]
MYTNILIAEDHPLVRAGVKNLLNDYTVYEASCGTEVQGLLTDHPDIDLVLLDLVLPDVNGLDLLKQISHDHPELPIIILSAYDDSELMRRCLDAGASGFIPKSSSHEVILNAVKLVLSGGVFIPPEMLRNTNNHMTPTRLLGIGKTLTERQIEVLRCIAAGKSNRDIAQALVVSENTIKVHVAHILKSLDASNRTEAVVNAQKLGLVSKQVDLE